MMEYRWALPAALLGDTSDGRLGRVRRSTRDWIVDITLFLLAALVTLLAISELQGRPQHVVLVEQVIGAGACAAVWLRRRWPVGLAVGLLPFTMFAQLASGAVIVAVFTVAVHRPFRVVAVVGGLHMAATLPWAAFYPDPELKYWGTVVSTASFYLLTMTWGMFVQARRQLVHSLRERAHRAEVEAGLREERARHLERERIAREMHDVLAHRISLLSLHAGALEFRPDAPAAEISRAAGAIRSSAHQALQDLREVIGVLRHGQGDGQPERPQPTLADLSDLVEESRQAGMSVAFEMSVTGEPPEALGRNVYRIVQEALTNARKHAGGEQVAVRVGGAPGEGVTAEVHNRVPALAASAKGAGGGPPAPDRIPGAGTGLIGMTERAELAGGRLEYGHVEHGHVGHGHVEHGHGPGGDFRLKAWLPWPA
ncbi:Signal transduction histidine kinase [Sinosporangium album]|uniref:histidine kinase n=1 Tax=Sinosporangium album TaxID=504805 RepID=A0A1G7XM57_9ACTN|nr:histidine kinase [Sinosporangium album]SDG85166.1 Signal transduction histidine kinase [Sinosporangium album]